MVNNALTNGHTLALLPEIGPREAVYIYSVHAECMYTFEPR